MVEGRNAGCSHSQKDFPIRGRWFWKIYELQPFITNELFCSHCTHSSSRVFVGWITVWPSSCDFSHKVAFVVSHRCFLSFGFVEVFSAAAQCFASCLAAVAD